MFAGLYHIGSMVVLSVFAWFLCALLLCLWLIAETVKTCPARFNIGGVVGVLISDAVRCYESMTPSRRRRSCW